jgi:hypothetical protein
MLQQVRDAVVDLARVDEVVIDEDQHDVLLDARH